MILGSLQEDQEDRLTTSAKDLYKVGTDFPEYLKETQAHCRRPLLIPPCDWTRRVSLSPSHSFHVTDCPPHVHGWLLFSRKCFIISFRTIYSKVIICSESPIFRFSSACMIVLGKLRWAVMLGFLCREESLWRSLCLLSQGTCGMSHQLCSL